LPQNFFETGWIISGLGILINLLIKINLFDILKILCFFHFSFYLPEAVESKVFGHKFITNPNLSFKKLLSVILRNFGGFDSAVIVLVADHIFLFANGF